MYSFASINSGYMKILLIGASGNIGKLIYPAIAEKHEVVTAGRHHGDFMVDLASLFSIENLFKEVTNIDAVICAAGDSISADLHLMSDEKYMTGIQHKLLSQINLVLVGMKFVNDNGSFTLISGKMGERPAKAASGKAVANGAINSFVLGAALEMPRGIRLNVVSPAKITDIPAPVLAAGYLKSINTLCNGEIIRIGYS
jgi:NAD(P)-dependent dehydrogenase (short-subunit alcohol dehydrogenase family)